jgi:hypothetical protein
VATPALFEGHEGRGHVVSFKDRVRSSTGEVAAEPARIVRRKFERHGARVSLNRENAERPGGSGHPASRLQGGGIGRRWCERSVPRRRHDCRSGAGIRSARPLYRRSRRGGAIPHGRAQEYAVRWLGLRRPYLNRVPSRVRQPVPPLTAGLCSYGSSAQTERSAWRLAGPAGAGIVQPGELLLLQLEAALDDGAQVGLVCQRRRLTRRVGEPARRQGVEIQLPSTARRPTARSPRPRDARRPGQVTTPRRGGPIVGRRIATMARPCSGRRCRPARREPRGHDQWRRCQWPWRSLHDDQGRPASADNSARTRRGPWHGDDGGATLPRPEVSARARIVLVSTRIPITIGQSQVPPPTRTRAVNPTTPSPTSPGRGPLGRRGSGGSSRAG